jgi:hypothetical protein
MLGMAQESIKSGVVSNALAPMECTGILLCIRECAHGIVPVKQKSFLKGLSHSIRGLQRSVSIVCYDPGVNVPTHTLLKLPR